MALTIDHTLLPRDALVLVTGANGLLGSHVAAQLLRAGFRVRGTVRSVDKSAWLLPLFNHDDDPSAPARFELVAVPDMAAAGAFDAAVRGVAAVAHVASVMGGGGTGHADRIVQPVVAGAVNVLEAARREPGVRRVVYTSSSTAAYTPAPRGGAGGDVDEGTWNEETVREAYAPEEEGVVDRARRSLQVYGASKMLAERAVWRWVEEEKPGFGVNAVLPNVNFGRSLDPVNQGHPSTSSWPVKLALGTFPEYTWDAIVPQYWVNVEDTALLHVAALTRPDIVGSRIFAFAGEYNWNTVLAALRKMYPEKEFYADREGLGHDLSRIHGAARAEQILKDMGRPGWKSLEESLRENLEDVKL